MAERIYNVLFLCTANTSRSVMAEGILNALGQGRFKAYSAGSTPAGKVNPFALEQLRTSGLPTDGYRSKSWDEFATPDSPKMDFVFTVCSSAAGEVCPIWPGHPASAHWGIPDPAAVKGTQDDKRQAFSTAYAQLSRRIAAFLKLPIEQMNAAELKQALQAIGKWDDATEQEPTLH